MFETDPLSVWFFHALSAEGLPAICIDARPQHLATAQAWHAVRLRAAELGRKPLADARRSDASRLLMAVPGVGVVTATSFVTAIKNPTNFKHSRSVGAWVKLTIRRYQSGEIDFGGQSSRRGDSHLRALLYEAATVLLVRSRSECDLRR